MEYPLRLKAYALRRGSGGVGTWTGGEGVIREFAALAPMEASVLAERRRHAPAGAAGGAPGGRGGPDRERTRLEPRHSPNSYSLFFFEKKKKTKDTVRKASHRRDHRT